MREEPVSERGLYEVKQLVMGGKESRRPSVYSSIVTISGCAPKVKTPTVQTSDSTNFIDMQLRLRCGEFGG